MKLSKVSHAFLALISAQIIVNVNAQPVDEAISRQQQNEEAKSALKNISDLAINPKARNVVKLAEKMHFSYQILGCHPTNEFSDFCQYQVVNRESASAKILILALGSDKSTGKTGGRVVWSAIPDKACLSQETAVSLFGQGNSRMSNIPDTMGGGNAPNVETKEYSYRSIPGGTPSSSAIISYRNNCIHQVFLDF